MLFSPLSEACAGGDVKTVTFLLDEGADINSIGHFHRTPLYRAAFGGHLDVVKVLNLGCLKPLILNEDGEIKAPFMCFRLILLCMIEQVNRPI